MEELGLSFDEALAFLAFLATGIAVVLVLGFIADVFRGRRE